MGIELEWKYRTTSEEQAAIQAAYPGDYRPCAMRTTYFDTPNRDFSSRFWTLRHRMENEVGICTLKTPAPGGGRLEYEAQAPDLASGVALLIKQGAPEELSALASQATPCCGAAFTRLARIICLDNATVELALDQGVLLGGGRELPFAEVEVELKTGEASAAKEFAQALAETFELETQPLSKFARAAQLGGL